MLMKNNSNISEMPYNPEDSMRNMKGTMTTMLGKTPISSTHPNTRGLLRTCCHDPLRFSGVRCLHHTFGGFQCQLLNQISSIQTRVLPILLNDLESHCD